MAFTEEDREKMDKAAAEAEEDLNNLSNEAVKEIGAWWRKHYMKAGHKRLARVLLQITK